MSHNLNLICSNYKLLLFANRLLEKYMYILICRPALTSLYVMMLIKKTLQARYDGPYKVLELSEKYFKLDIKGK